MNPDENADNNSAPKVDQEAAQAADSNKEVDQLDQQDVVEPEANTNPSNSSLHTDDALNHQQGADTHVQDLAPPSTKPEAQNQTSDEAPQAGVTAAPSLLGGSAVQSKSNKKRTFGIVAAVIALLLFFIGGGTYAYLGVYVPNQPENVMKLALANTLQSGLEDYPEEQYRIEGNIAVDGEYTAGINGMSFDVYFHGPSESSEGTIKIDATVTTLNLDYKMPSDESRTYAKLSGLKGVDKIISAYLGTGDSLSQDDVYSDLVSQVVAGVENQWFMIENSLLGSNENGDPLATPELTEQEMTAIAEAYEQHQFLVVVEQKEDEVIHGIDSLQYEVEVDKSKLVEFMTAIKNANIEAFSVDDNIINEISNQDLINSAAMWVSKERKEFTQISFTLDQDGTQLSVRASITPTNEERTIQAPQGAKSVLELIGELSPLLYGNSTGTVEEFNQTTPFPLDDTNQIQI